MEKENNPNSFNKKEKEEGKDLKKENTVTCNNCKAKFVLEGEEDNCPNCGLVYRR